jgi:hypothetical protein
MGKKNIISRKIGFSLKSLTLKGITKDIIFQN